ncbi:MAG: hypothetical protein HFH74_02275 [Lachnospiraceae bacterium]|nr:hypothetical protein [Lachnospiraceae bacterium]
MTQQQLKQAADLLNTKPLKSDNIELGSVIPLSDGRKGVIVKEVEICSKHVKQS